MSDQENKFNSSRRPVKTPVMYRTGPTVNMNIDEQERSVCFICAAEHPSLWSVSECNHRVCSICSLRMRSLYENKKCAMCKTESPRVIVVRAKVESNGVDHTKNFDELWSDNLPSINEFKMYFCDVKAREDTLKLLKIFCPVQKCKDKDIVWSSKQELRKHVYNAHNMSFCDVCLTHKKAFPFEFKVYTKTELQRHQKGDSRGSSGHPSCELCGTLFYSDDELTEHMRDKHESCHICQRRPGGKPRYFKDYSTLEEHFKNDHYLCTNQLCLELKFIVFETELEYKAHVADVHLSSTKMQRSAQKQFRRVEPGFLFGETPSTSNNRRTPVSSKTSRNQSNEITPQPVTLDAIVPAKPIEPIPQGMIKNLLYGEGIGDLAQRLQSLNLYEQQNINFSESLKKDFLLSDNTISTFKRLCRSFQRDELGAIDLILKLDSLIGIEKLERMTDSILSLQLDTHKRLQLNNALKSHQKKIASFPPLPTIPLEENQSSITRSNKFGTSIGQRLTKTDYLPVLRIKPMPTNLRSTSLVDPSKNPMALLGPIKSAASLSRTDSTPIISTSKKKHPPSFRQAIASSSSTGIVDQPSPPSSNLDVNNFPALDGQNINQSSSPELNSGKNVFVSSDNRNDPDTFTIGNSSHQQEFESKMEGAITGNIPTVGSDIKSSSSKKKKGTVLFRYG